MATGSGGGLAAGRGAWAAAAWERFALGCLVAASALQKDDVRESLRVREQERMREEITLGGVPGLLIHFLIVPAFPPSVGGGEVRVRAAP